ncbi:MAG: hypothetical protein AAB652_02530 [Patescibacteria group bacterium]
MKRIISTKKGYIAITSAVMMMGIIIFIVFTIGFTSFLSRANLSHSYYKDKTLGLAEGCLQVALYKLTQSSTYSGAETIPVDTETCRVVSVVASTTRKIIVTQGEYQKAYTNLRITIDEADFALLNWEELTQ